MFHEFRRERQKVHEIFGLAGEMAALVQRVLAPTTDGTFADRIGPSTVNGYQLHIFLRLKGLPCNLEQ